MPYPFRLSIVMAESRKLVSDSYFQGFCGGTCRSRPHTSIFPFVVLSLRASSCQKSPHHAAGEAPLPKDSCHDSQGDLTVLKAIEEPDQTLTSRLTSRRHIPRRHIRGLETRLGAPRTRPTGGLQQAQRPRYKPTLCLVITHFVSPLAFLSSSDTTTSLVTSPM